MIWKQQINYLISGLITYFVDVGQHNFWPETLASNPKSQKTWILA